jgi:hypothetical protein
MDVFSDLIYWLSVALSPNHLLYLAIGMLVGMVVGVMPGLGASAGIAVLLPLIFGMDPVSAIVMLAAIYYGAMFGGTITSVLIYTPGESSTVASIVRYSKGGASWRGCRGSPAGRGVVRWRDSSSGSSSVSSGTGEPSALWSVASLEKTLAGFIIPFGSSARLMARIASSAGPCSRAMYGARAAPTPCSPVTVPPILSASS